MTPDLFHAWQLDRAREIAPADWRLLPPGGVDLVSATLQKQREQQARPVSPG